MESSSEMIALPRPPSKKWVTFDADMESGKLSKGDGDATRRHSRVAIQ